MSSFLIINADDYGYNSQQTDAITQLYKNGLITSASFLAPAPFAREAAELAVREDIVVGVHLTINSDDKQERWQSLTGRKSLTDGRGLYESQLRLALHAKRRDVAEELEAQYEFISKRGVKIDHADNHSGTLYGINGRRFYHEAFEFCARHGLPYRFPKTPAFLEEQIHMRLPKPLLLFQRHIVKIGEALGVKMLDNLASNPQSVKEIGSYENLRKYYLGAVDRCADGVNEIFLHPALPLEGGHPEWQKRVWEYELLKSGDLMQRAEDKKIKPVSWRIFDEII